MAQAVTHQPSTLFDPQVNPCRICGRRSGTGKGLSPSSLHLNTRSYDCWSETFNRGSTRNGRRVWI